MQAAKTNMRITRLALAALMVVAVALVLPGRAHADDLDGVPRTITGTCYIGETWMVGDQSFFAIPSFSGGLSGAVPSRSFGYACDARCCSQAVVSPFGQAARVVV